MHSAGLHHGQRQYPPARDVLKVTSFITSILYTYIHTHWNEWKTPKQSHVKYATQTVQNGPRSHKIKLDNFKSFKRELKSFLLQNASYSVDEFMSFWSYVDCKVRELYRWACLHVLTNADIRAPYRTVPYCTALYLRNESF